MELLNIPKLRNPLKGTKIFVCKCNLPKNPLKKYGVGSVTFYYAESDILFTLFKYLNLNNVTIEYQGDH